MMDDRAEKTVAELVLIAFENACPQPSDEDIDIWSARHPQYAEQIAAFGSILKRAKAERHYEDKATLTEKDFALAEAATKAFMTARSAQYEKTLQDVTERQTAGHAFRPLSHER